MLIGVFVRLRLSTTASLASGIKAQALHRSACVAVGSGQAEWEHIAVH